MTPEQIAALIAAGAFVVLVILIGIFLIKTMKTLGAVNQSVKTVTQDVDVLSKQAEEIMANANVLLEDVNQKMETVDPVFKAAADLGTSVSDLNTATRKFTGKVSKSAKATASAGLFSKLGKTAFNVYRNRKDKQ